MLRAKNSFRKSKTGYVYTGDLQECIHVAERRIANLHADDKYIERMYKEAKRRYEAHFKAIETAEDFIYCATRKLEEQKKQEKAE